MANGEKDEENEKKGSAEKKGNQEKGKGKVRIQEQTETMKKR